MAGGGGAIPTSCSLVGESEAVAPEFADSRARSGSGGGSRLGCAGAQDNGRRRGRQGGAGRFPTPGRWVGAAGAGRRAGGPAGSSRTPCPGCPRGIVVVTGTNGKTTTTKMLVAILRQHGLRVFSNPTGSNFTRGVISSMLGEIPLSGRLDADMAVLELDEAHALRFTEHVKPTHSLLLNVARDQLDRFAEIDATAQLLAPALRADHPRRRAQHRRLVHLPRARPDRRRGGGALLRCRPLDRRPPARAAGGRRPVRRRLHRTQAGRRGRPAQAPRRAVLRGGVRRGRHRRPGRAAPARAGRHDQRHRRDDHRADAAARGLPRGRDRRGAAHRAAAVRPRRGHRRRTGSRWSWCWSRTPPGSPSR